MTIDNELLAKFGGRWKDNINHDWKYVPFSNHHGWEEAEYECSFCGKYVKTNTPPQEPCSNNSNPSYSTSPDDRERLWGYLMGKEEMWKEFFWWCWNSSPKEAQDLRDRFVAWLTLPLDGVPRWVGLLSDWLGMEETREKFGWVECPQYTPDTDELVRGICTFIECSKRNAQCVTSGKIRAEWAR